MHWPKSEGCRPVDHNLGGVAQSSSRRHTGGGIERQCTPLQEGNAGNVALRKVHH